MQVTNKIEIHLDDKRRVPPIDAVQGDSCTRVLEFTLYSGSEAWNVPEGVDVWIGYCGDGGKGIYSKLSEADDAAAAYSVDGNVVAVTLIPQVTAVAGHTELNVMFQNKATKQQIATFGVTIRIARNPATGAGKPQDYFDIRQWVSAGPLIVTIKKNEDGSFQLADNSPGHDKILVAVDAGREVICRAGADVLPLQFVTNGQKIRFQSFKREEYKCVEIDTDNSVSFEKAQLAYKADLAGYAKTSDFGGYAKTTDLAGYAKSSDLDGYAAKADLEKYVLEDEVTTKATDERFFDIDPDGLVSLKPEYRGDPYVYAYSSGEIVYPFSLSDVTHDNNNKASYEGSKISELPERIIIPDNVDGQQVTGFQSGMFCGNKRIKEVVLPKSVRELPGGMFREAIHLEKVGNTEQITKVGNSAFAFTRVGEVRLPNLTSDTTYPCNSLFQNCSCLVVVDIGNIASIGKNMFEYCENLSQVLGGSNVTTIGEQAFYSTRRLKGLSFLANLTSIGNMAFFSSRCDFEEVYDALVTKGCSFGDLATYKQYGGEDYWSGTTFTPCKTPLNSLFHQRNPLWKDKQIASYIERITDGTPVLDEDGNEIPCTYGSNGCAFITLAEIYSAFEGVSFSSPEEFVTILKQKNLLQYDYRYRSGWRAIAEGLGYEVKDMDADIDEGETEPKPKMSKDDLQEIYDALAAGALVYRSTGGSSPDGGHATLWYGINSEGEALVSDTAMHCDGVGIYENHKSAWHTYKNGSDKCDAVIVMKKA